MLFGCRVGWGGVRGGLCGFWGLEGGGAVSLDLPTSFMPSPFGPLSVAPLSVPPKSQTGREKSFTSAFDIWGRRIRGVSPVAGWDGDRSMG